VKTTDSKDGWEMELGVARRAASAAADLLRKGAGRGTFREKGRNDLVTEVDEAAEARIVEILEDAFPDDAVVAEEAHTESVTQGRRWIIDPVDGTTNLVHGHPFCCVSIALVDDTGPAVAVVDAPFLDEVYTAVRGKGAWLGDERLRVSTVERLEESLCGTGFPFRKGKGDPAAYMRLVGEVVVGSHGVRRAGSAALDLAYVAAGRLDGFFEIGLAPWDVAAGILLVTEAGGRVTGWPGDGAPPIVTGRIIASNGRMHEGLESLIEPYTARI